MRIDVEEEVVNVLKREFEIRETKFVRQARGVIERAFVDLVTDYRHDVVRKKSCCNSVERQALTDILSNDIEFFIVEIRLKQNFRGHGKFCGKWQ